MSIRRPRIPLTDPRFVYVPAHLSDIRVRFEQHKREQRLAQADTQRVIDIMTARQEKK